MADDDRAVDAEAPEGLGEKGSLGGSRPMAAPRPLAVPEARPVEGDGPVALSCSIDDAADQQVLDHRPVAMQKHDGPAAAALHVVKADAARGDEATSGGMGNLGLASLPLDEDGRARHRHAGQHEEAAAPGPPR